MGPKDQISEASKDILRKMGAVEAMMVEGFPVSIPDKYAALPRLEGRATVAIDVDISTKGRVISASVGNVSTSYYLRNEGKKGGTNYNAQDTLRVTFVIDVDGYSAPITSGQFVDLVSKGFYDGMDVQRADDFVVQTGDPDPRKGPHGFLDPEREDALRNVPLEIKRTVDKVRARMSCAREGVAAPACAAGARARAARADLRAPLHFAPHPEPTGPHLRGDLRGPRLHA